MIDNILLFLFSVYISVDVARYAISFIYVLTVSEYLFNNLDGIGKTKKITCITDERMYANITGFSPVFVC